MCFICVDPQYKIKSPKSLLFFNFLIEPTKLGENIYYFLISKTSAKIFPKYANHFPSPSPPTIIGALVIESR